LVKEWGPFYEDLLHPLVYGERSPPGSGWSGSGSITGFINKADKKYPMKRTRYRIFIFSLIFPLIASAVFIAIVYFQVSKDASSRINRGVIDSVIFSESPVFYDDGQTPIGVFFEKTHRKYINHRDIPKIFIKALIASEDGNFFSHPGFDLKAMLRALLANVKTRKVVQGGSTITQQTAKNIFKRQRKKKSLRSMRISFL
jgi:membrane peptidoglycan carboxypeptidase